MFALPPRLAWTLAAVAAAAAGGTVAVRVAGIEPRFEFHLSPASTTEDMQVLLLRATPRGGVAIEDVHLETVRGEVGFQGRLHFESVPPVFAPVWTLRFPRDSAETPRVRLRQGGAWPRTYDIDLPVDRR